ncbi:MAG: AAA family ATPase, partial [Bellilinea sp.]
MVKTQTRFVCQNCGRSVPRQLGRCPSCGEYGTMVEEIIQEEPAYAGASVRGLTGRSQPRKLTDISSQGEERLALPIAEFARVLGGGVVPGSIVLVGGDPGIGKSTLVLQMTIEMAAEFSRTGYPSSAVLYVSGEESERQIKMRAVRLMDSGTGNGGKFNPPDNLLLVTETNMDTIFEHVQQIKPGLLIIDSIQTVYLPELSSSAGSVSQVRECASRLRELAKSTGM